MTSLSQKPEKTADQIRDLLLAAGIHPTAQRLRIASLLLNRDQYISAEEILAGVNCQQPGASKATVYNTLNLFVKKGLIRELLIDPGRIFYDSNTSNHHHLFNLDTGELTDITALKIPADQLPALADDQILEGFDVIIRVRNADTAPK